MHSLRYHQLNPNYIHERLKQLGHSYELRVLLTLIDIVSFYYLHYDDDDDEEDKLDNSYTYCSCFVFNFVPFL